MLYLLYLSLTLGIGFYYMLYLSLTLGIGFYYMLYLSLTLGIGFYCMLYLSLTMGSGFCYMLYLSLTLGIGFYYMLYLSLTLGIGFYYMLYLSLTLGIGFYYMLYLSLTLGIGFYYMLYLSLTLGIGFCYICYIYLDTGHWILLHVISVATELYKYDSGNVTPTSRSLASSNFSRSESIGSTGSTPELPKRPALQPLTRSINSAFEDYEKPLSPRIQQSGGQPFNVGTGQIRPNQPYMSDSMAGRHQGPGVPSGGAQGIHLKPNLGLKSGQPGDNNASDRSTTPSSLISHISNELTDIAQSASSTMSELFGTGSKSPHQFTPKPQKPFAPLGKFKQNSSLFNRCLTKQTFKGVMTLIKAIVHGLEHTFQNHGLGGMASAYMVLEIIHTHYMSKDVVQGTARNSHSDTSITPEINSPFGSHESLSSKSEDSPQKSEARSLHEEHMVAALGSPVLVNGEEFENIEIQSLSEMSSSGGTSGGAVLLTKKPAIDHNRNPTKISTTGGQTCDIIITNTDPESKLDSPIGEDVMRQLVKNKAILENNRDKRLSIDSEVSEASTLVSTSSETIGDETKRKKRINHHSIRGAMSDSEMEMSGVVNYHKRLRSPSTWSSKSSLSTGFRYHEGKMLNTSPVPHCPDSHKLYLFEGLVNKDRSRLWDQLQFWEDVYLDAVAQERDIIGMDQGPGEMMDRYRSLSDGDRKRLEHDEDRLLSVMLYNLVAFMVMVRVHKQEIRKKTRRLLGKCHIGLVYSQDVNNLLDQINNLHGNDIDLRPMGSRFMQKQSFTVHWGSDNSGDMLFMEVCTLG
ncbi:hypothetical protein KUTeg_023117 [Tegillarca granosa]|uniref:MAP kinase-activating death domain-containing protein n=1 Tax=Tegillarca granosa TaxID=220873 RepID=A0ABQ9E596_TEGGR|nr:hypothetical protein KUTeg_023117 [Tegillarca granosa]